MISVKLIEESALDVRLENDSEISVDVAEITQTGGQSFKIGDGLKLENNVLSVDTAEVVEKDNTKPVTSAAVYTEIGNIEALLAIL
jgi:hypothetical protein